jgi:glycine cleavage system H protein
MSQVPADLRYTRSHEWIRPRPDGSCDIGITDHAQSALGDLVFVEAPDPGRVVKAGEACAVVESVKAASDVYSPLDGEVLARNDALAAEPELINKDCYGAGWLMRVRPTGANAADALLDAAAYAAHLAAEGH